MKNEFHFYDLPYEKTYIRMNDNYRLKFFENIEKKINKNELLNLLGCCGVSLNKWKKGSCAISTIIVVKISKLIKDEKFNLKNIEKNITHIYSGRKTKKQGSIGKYIKNPNFPIRLSPNLARLIANIIGDGNIKLNWYYNTTYFNKEMVLIDEVKNNSLNVFGEFKYNINKGKDDIYYINLPSIVGMILFFWFGDFSSKRSKVPEQILYSKNNKIKYNFIQGIFDDEGTVDIKSRVLKVYSSNKILIEGIRNLLIDIGIKPTKVYNRSYITTVNKIKGINYTVAISNLKGIKIFSDKVSFLHPKKHDLLKSIIKQAKQ